MWFGAHTDCRGQAQANKANLAMLRAVTFALLQVWRCCSARHSLTSVVAKDVLQKAAYVPPSVSCRGGEVGVSVCVCVCVCVCVRLCVLVVDDSLDRKLEFAMHPWAVLRRLR